MDSCTAWWSCMGSADRSRPICSATGTRNTDSPWDRQSSLRSRQRTVKAEAETSPLRQIHQSSYRRNDSLVNTPVLQRCLTTSRQPTHEYFQCENPWQQMDCLQYCNTVKVTWCPTYYISHVTKGLSTFIPSSLSQTHSLDNVPNKKGKYTEYVFVNLYMKY